MKNSIVSAILVLVLIVLGAWFYKSRLASPASGVAASAANPGPLTLSEDSYSFGTIRMADGLVSKIITATNNTGGDIMIDKITTSCMCTVAYVSGGPEKKGPFGMPGHGGAVKPANELIKNGEAREIEVVFDPNAHGPAGVGQIERAVYFEDSSGRVTEFQFKGLVTP